MALPTSFSALLAELAGGKNKRPKLAAKLGRTYWEVTYWSRKNEVPQEYWDDLIRLAAAKKMAGVTREYLQGLSKGRDDHDEGRGAR
jgi:hypothetical protein